MVNNNLQSIKTPLLLKNYPPIEVDKVKSRRELINGRYTCSFCGFHHLKNFVDSINNEYFVIDPFCYFSLHVSLLNDDDATIVFLPHLPREDVSNLQRTIFIALHSDDLSLRQKANDIHMWLLSHEKYIESHYGTASFKEWKKVISLTNTDGLDGIHIICFLIDLSNVSFGDIC